MKIAIQANPNRGKEIISLLESLGSTKTTLRGDGELYTYYIDDNNVIRHDDAPKDYKVYTLEEFKKEFPFKIGDKVTIIGLPDYPKVITKMTWMNNEIFYTFGDNTWYNTGALRKLEMKEERNITLTLDKAKEWYKKGGGLKQVALQAFTEKELNPLPKSWEEYCIKHGMVCLSTRYTNISLKHDALIKLECLRDCWRHGWEPTEYNTGYHIIRYPKNYLILAFNFISFLSFPTKEMAEEFLKCFRDLIEQAGDLIS